MTHPAKYLPGLASTIMPIFAVDATTRVVHHRGRVFCETLFIHDSYVVNEYAGREAKPLRLGDLPWAACPPLEAVHPFLWFKGA
jgi:hypothetical protein